MRDFMKIDWFTFAAQIINFLILLALLKRFLYRPILKAIDDREAEIASRFEKVEEQQKAVDFARDDFEAKKQELVHAKQQLLAEAAEECEQWKSERLAEARIETEQTRADWFASLDRERGQLKDNLLSQYRQHSLRLAEGVLSCLADKNAQDFLIDAFVRRLLETESKVSVDQPADASVELTMVRTAFELSSTQREKIEEALVSNRAPLGEIQFRVDESLICGVEIRTHDHEVAWNVYESLDYLAADFSRDLDATLTVPVGLSSDPMASPEVSHAT